MSQRGKRVTALDSYIVSHFGLDGKREHYMPGNRRKGIGIREKRGFASEEAARRFLVDHGLKRMRVYRCSICDQWHTASPGRR